MADDRGHVESAHLAVGMETVKCNRVFPGERPS